jgi:hypothetical protein
LLGTWPRRPQFIEPSAVCNSKMRIGTVSLLCSEFRTTRQEPWEDALVRMALFYGRAIALPSAIGRVLSFSRRISAFRRVGCRSRATHARLCGIIATLRRGLSCPQTDSCHLCAPSRHLSSPSDASDESWAARRIVPRGCRFHLRIPRFRTGFPGWISSFCSRCLRRRFFDRKL